MVQEDILEAYNSTVIPVEKDSFVFMEGEKARHYYQVKSGSVKMVNYNDEGKEFVQGIFKKGQSFGEPPLFGNFAYPASAQALERSEIFKLSYNAFIELLQNHFDVHLKLTETLSHRLHYKAMIMSEISIHEAAHRLLTFFDYLKEENGKVNETYAITLTRQQLADLLGLRVETVIRSVKNLEDQGTIVIRNGKIIR